MRVVIAGAGVGGLTLAAALCQRGLEVEVHERSAASGAASLEDDPVAAAAAGSGLSVMTNAVLALRHAGLAGPVLDASQPMREFEVFDARGRPIFATPFGELGDALGAPSLCVHRGELLAALASHLPAGVVRHGSEVAGFRQREDAVEVELAGGARVSADLLVGADGFHSRVRTALLGEQPARVAGYVAHLAVIPFAHEAWRPGLVHHYWGRGKRVGLVDLSRGRLYWWTTENTRDRSEAALATRLGVDSMARLLDAFAGWPPLVRAALEATDPRQVLRVRTRDRAPVRRWVEGRVALLGDAAHPMLTSVGQGAGMAIEDAVVLADLLSPAADVADALRRYEARRRERANAMVRLTRQVSWYEQLEGPISSRLRDAVFRLMPARVSRKQMEQMMRYSP